MYVICMYVYVYIYVDVLMYVCLYLYGYLYVFDTAFLIGVEGCASAYSQLMSMLDNSPGDIPLMMITRVPYTVLQLPTEYVLSIRHLTSTYL